MTMPNTPAPEAVSAESVPVTQADRAFELWFFRDLTDEQRVGLFRLAFGDGVANEASNHGLQRRVLRILKTRLSAQRAPAVEELRGALSTATGIASGPNGRGKMKVVVDGLEPGAEFQLHSLLSTAFSRPAAPADADALLDVERDILRLISETAHQQGVSMHDWVTRRMREAAETAMASKPTPPATVAVPVLVRMKPWPEDHSAPVDWDGGTVLFENGALLDPTGFVGEWKSRARAYTSATPPEPNARGVETRAQRALNLARCLAKAEYRSEIDRCVDEAKAIIEGGPFQLAALAPPPAAVETIAFVQEWMMSGDHEPTQWDRDFAAAIDARAQRATPAAVEVPAGWPKPCDGKEQQAFEDYARGCGMNMDTHPLHWLFLDKQTAAAREGWRGALAYVDRTLTAAPAAGDAGEGK